MEGTLGFGKYGYLGQWCKGAGFDSKSRTAHLGASAECKPVTAQIVSTTSRGRVLVAGTGLEGITELKEGATIPLTGHVLGGTAVADSGWTGRASGGPNLYSHLYHGEVYDATQEGAGGAGRFVPLAPWPVASHPMGPLSPHAFPTIRRANHTLLIKMACKQHLDSRCVFATGSQHLWCQWSQTKTRLESRFCNKEV